MSNANRLNPRILAATLALLLVAATVPVSGAQTPTGRRGGAGRAEGARLPRFEDYPAGSVYRGRVAPVVIGGRRERRFRTRLREDSRAGPNFAGRYTVVFWGCGTGCAQVAVVDAATGRVYWPPLDYVDIPDPDAGPYGAGYRVDSRLLVLTRSRYDRESSYTAYYYVFDRGRFRLARRAERKRRPVEAEDQTRENDPPHDNHH